MTWDYSASHCGCITMHRYTHTGIDKYHRGIANLGDHLKASVSLYFLQDIKCSKSFDHICTCARYTTDLHTKTVFFKTKYKFTAIPFRLEAASARNLHSGFWRSLWTFIHSLILQQQGLAVRSHRSRFWITRCSLPSSETGDMALASSGEKLGMFPSFL